MGKRQFGFAFLLFVPYIAYWGYDIWLRWYARYYHASKKDDSDVGCNNESNVLEKSEAQETTVETLSANDYKTTITNVYNGNLNTSDCFVLLSMLRSSDTSQLCDGLKLLQQVSVKSPAQSKETLFHSNISKELSRLVRSRKVLGNNTTQQVLTVINNLSMSEEGQTEFSCLVEELMDVSVEGDDALANLSLLSLVNLSVTSASQGKFTKVISILYKVLDSQPVKRVNVLRILVNLSANEKIVPYLLAAESPPCALILLNSTDDVTARWLQFLVNITSVVLKGDLSQDKLPTLYKAASPDTLYSFLYCHSSQSDVCNRLIMKGQFKTDNAVGLANKLYKNLKYKGIIMTQPSSSVDVL